MPDFAPMQLYVALGIVVAVTTKIVSFSSELGRDVAYWLFIPLFLAFFAAWFHVAGWLLTQYFSPNHMSAQDAFHLALHLFVMALVGFGGSLMYAFQIKALLAEP